MSQPSISPATKASLSQRIGTSVSSAEEEASRLVEIVQRTRQHLETNIKLDPRPHGYYLRTVCDSVTTHFEDQQTKIQERSILTEASTAKNDYLATDAQSTAYISGESAAIEKTATRDELDEVLGVFQDEAERFCKDESERRTEGRSLIRAEDDPSAPKWPDLRRDLDAIITEVNGFYEKGMSLGSTRPAGSDHVTAEKRLK